MIWKDRKYINPRKRIFKNMDTNDILNLELQDDDENIEEESETPLNAHNLNQAQQDLIDDMSKTYTGTSITANTVAGYGRINKTWGSTANGMNLFDKSTVTLSKYLTNQGTLASQGEYIVTDYIPCEPQKPYIASGYTIIGAAPCRCYYDKNKTIISAISHNNNPENMEFTTPANCYYFRESVYRTDLDTFKIQKGSVATPYSSYGYGIVEIISKNGDNQSSNIYYVKGGLAEEDYIDFKLQKIIRANGTEEPLDCSNKIVQYEGETIVYNRDGAKIEVSLTNNESISGLNENIGNVENKVNKMSNYTTQEQIIGTWINDKPIYRKVIEYNTTETIGSANGTTNTLIPHGISNLDRIINHSMLDSSDTIYPVAGSNSSNVPQSAKLNYYTNTAVNFRVINTTITARTFYIILEYTKTTD